MVKNMIRCIAFTLIIMTSIGLTGCGTNSKSDLEYVKNKGTLVVGLDDTFAPMGFRDKADKLVGFDIDLARAVTKKMRIKVKFQPIDWSAKEGELKSKNIDCVWNGMSATSNRQKSMSLSNRYLKNRILIMSLDPNVKVNSADDLKNIKIGTQADSSALEVIKKNDKYKEFKNNISEYKTYDEAILDMKAGRIKAVAIDEVYAIYNNENKDKLYESPFNFGADYYAVGFRKGDKKLTKEFNKAFKEIIDSGDAQKISEKGVGKDLVVCEGYDK